VANVSLYDSTPAATAAQGSAPANFAAAAEVWANQPSPLYYSNTTAYTSNGQKTTQTIDGISHDRVVVVVKYTSAAADLAEVRVRAWIHPPGDTSIVLRKEVIILNFDATDAIRFLTLKGTKSTSMTVEVEAVEVLGGTVTLSVAVQGKFDNQSDRIGAFARFNRITPGTNKFMAIIAQTPGVGPTFTVRRIWVMVDSLVAAAGVMLDQQIVRVTTGVPTAVTTTNTTVKAYDSADANALAQFTNLAAIGEAAVGTLTVVSTLKRFIFTNEEAVITEGLAQRFAADNMYKLIYDDAVDGFALRSAAAETDFSLSLAKAHGIAIQNVTNSVVGLCSYVIEFQCDG
jgi:hypothetical protein